MNVVRGEVVKSGNGSTTIKDQTGKETTIQTEQIHEVGKSVVSRGDKITDVICG